MPLEVACFSGQDAARAIEAGADRIELCSDRSVGGLSPSRLEIDYVNHHRTDQNVPIFHMIRPRAGDFNYSDEEFMMMKHSLEESAQSGADGFVFGILTDEAKVDEKRCKMLVTLAGGRTCTFHRAFDEIRDKDDALESVVRCGFKFLLTSGGGLDVVQGKKVLERLVSRANGRIEIMPGGGLRSSNVGDLKQDIHARWWHSSAITSGRNIDVKEVSDLKNAIDAA